MHEIDKRFRQNKQSRAQAAQRKRVRRFAGWLFAGLATTAVSIGAWLILGQPGTLVEPPVDVETPAEIPIFVPRVIELPGDPLRIELDTGPGHSAAIKTVAPTPALGAAGVSGPLSIVREKILLTGMRLMTTLPSSPEDFAFFQSQRQFDRKSPGEEAGQTGAAPAAATPPGETAEPMPDEAAGEAIRLTPAAPAETPGEPFGATRAVEVGAAPSGSDGWGDIGVAELGGSDEVYQRTEIENNVSTVTLVREDLRFKRVQDVFVRAVAAVTPEKFLIENGFNTLDARRAAAALSDRFGVKSIEAGHVIALRGLRDGPSAGAKLAQIALYTMDSYIGALSATPDGAFVEATDPWVADNLAERLSAPQTEAVAPKYRLLDGIYSVARRNGVPARVAGEAIMYLSRQHDLSEFAKEDDVFTLVYGEAPRGGETGRVLYVSVDRADKSLRCFLFLPRGGADFSCFDEKDQTGTIEVSNGMVTPVSGVLTSTFGPRRHPILKTVLMHKGVDWAAPVGTPIRAAFDGTVAFAGDGGGYGNFVKLDHGGGRGTGYAHMSAFAKGLATGQKVSAGDVIGFVGTTGRSTGPHLHFELYVGGEPMNPLQAAVATADASGAVERLVDRIIRVESGGSATAKNPLSSATGLGQFIESTWIRMMRTYRPDLANSLSREKLLALRFDPTLSREMVANLAREGKAYLEARGNSITAGRLYLCHFLGMDGAATVLAASDGAQLVDVLGSGVISANPFLTGKDVAYVKDWAERKMSGKSAPAPTVVTTKKIEQASPEFAAFREAIAAVVGLNAAI